MSTSLSRDDIVTGLRELIAYLHAANHVAGFVRIARAETPTTSGNFCAYAI